MTERDFNGVIGGQWKFVPIIGDARLVMTWKGTPHAAAWGAAGEARAAFREVTEVAFALPFTFEPEDYVQILTDIAESSGGPRLAAEALG